MSIWCHRNRFTLLDSTRVPATAATFASRSRRQLFVGFRDGSVACYDVDATAHIATLKGHSTAVLSLCARDSKEQLMSASLDNLVMWETKVRFALSG